MGVIRRRRRSQRSSPCASPTRPEGEGGPSASTLRAPVASSPSAGPRWPPAGTRALRASHACEEPGSAEIVSRAHQLAAYAKRLRWSCGTEGLRQQSPRRAGGHQKVPGQEASKPSSCTRAPAACRSAATYISQHDAPVEREAGPTCWCGGDAREAIGGSLEQYLLDLERWAFVELYAAEDRWSGWQSDQSQAGKVLRNRWMRAKHESDIMVGACRLEGSPPIALSRFESCARIACAVGFLAAIASREMQIAFHAICSFAHILETRLQCRYCSVLASVRRASAATCGTGHPKASSFIVRRNLASSQGLAALATAGVLTTAYCNDPAASQLPNS